MTALAEPALLDRLRVVGPYKGLAPFDESDLDALLFFGRDLEREVIEANLFASRLTVLYGQTGVGKSSLLRAGLVHALRDRAERNRLLQGHPDFAVVLFDRWNGEPVEDLAAATYVALVDLFGEDVVESPRDEPLADLLDRWTRELDTDLLLVLDQAEEYFLYHGGGQFEAELPELVTRPLRANVLLSLREDQLAKLDRFKGRIPNLFANYLRVDHLDPRAATAAILEPLERYNELTGESIEIEPALVEAILEQTLAGKVDLGRVSGAAAEAETGPVRVEAPYLQLVLQRLWQEERAAGSDMLRLGTLTALGGAEEIARTHLERALGQLDEPGRDVAASVFLHLVTPSGTKIALPVGDLAQYTGTPSDELEPVLHMLARERILKPVETPHSDTANGSYEIFHDVLGEAVLAWRARHTERRALEHERREARRRQRRLVGLFGIAIAAFAVMTAVAAYAVNQRQEADKQAQIAAQQTQDALEKTVVARAARLDAQRNLALAKARLRRAQLSETKAQVSEARAIDSEAKATASEAEARANEQDAKDAEARANQESARAQAGEHQTERALADATRQRKAAQRQTGIAHTQTLEAQREKTRAEAGAAEAQARALIPENPESAVEYALKAVRLERSHTSEDVLRDAFLALRVRAVLRPGSGAVRQAVFDGSGKHLLVAAAKGRARLYAVRTGDYVDFEHGGPILDAALTLDGRYVATAGATSIRIWDAGDGRLLATIDQPEPAVDIDFSPKGSLLATLDGDRARIWRVPTGEPLAFTPAHSKDVVGVLFNPTGTLFVTWVAGPDRLDRSAHVFRADTGEPVRALQQNGAVVGAKWDPSGKFLFTAGRLNGYVWSTTTWNRLQLLVGHTRPIRDAAFTFDGERLVTVGGQVGRLWRVSDGTQLLTLIGSTHELVAAAWTPDSTDCDTNAVCAVLTGGRDGVGRIWAQTGEGNPTGAYGGHSDTVNKVGYSADGKYAMTASLDGTARLWDPTRQAELRTIAAHDAPPARSTDVFHAAVFSPDGKLILSAGADGTARLWRPDGTPVLTLRHGGHVTRAVLIRGGSLVVTTSDDGTAKVWRVSDGRLLATMNHGSPIRALAAAGNLIVTAGDDGDAHVWTLNGRSTQTLHHGPRAEPGRRSLLAVAINAAATRVVTAGTDNNAIVWQPRTGLLLRTLAGHSDDVTAVAFDPTGRRVVTGSADGDARLWNVATGESVELVANFESFGVTTVKFNPKGDLLLTAYENGDVRTWHTSTGKLHKRFSRNVSVVADASFSPDGEWLVTAGPITAAVWQTRTGKLLSLDREMALGQRPTGPLTTAAFAPDGRRFVTASQDGVIRIGLCQVCTGIDELTRMAKRRLAQIVRPERPKAAR
jgi:WD40 repeat protein